MSTNASRVLFPVAVLVAMSAPAAQEARKALRLPNIFGDHMVLQRDKPVRVWGWAVPGQAVDVRIGETRGTAKADPAGLFSVALAPLETSAKGRDLVVRSGAERRVFADVLVGEVWVCGGQSNMEWTLRGSRDADVEIASADYEEIRFVRLPKIARSEPQVNFPVANRQSAVGNWRRAVSSQVENCTAVGYYFARRLHRRLRVPVGIVDTSWGGTMAQHWVTRSTLAPIEEMRPYLDKHEKNVREWVDGGGEPGARQRYVAAVAAWDKASAAARAKGAREPRQPNRNAFENPLRKAQPSGMWNGVVAPITKFAIRGVLFYQGENNSFTVGWKPFPKTFPAVIADWRAGFGDPDLPFGIVQIAGWSTRRSMHYDMNHHTNIVREVQFLTWQRTPHTGLVATYDTNSNGSIHPARKQPVGERSARWALAEVYRAKDRVTGGKPIEWRGPVYRSARIENGKIAASFDPATARGLRLDRDIEVGFYIAGEDRVFHHARVKIVKGEVVAWSDAVPKPVALRYGWSNLPSGGLMNGRELPAYPFRTDDWPMVPHQSDGSYVIGRK